MPKTFHVAPLRAAERFAGSPDFPWKVAALA